MYSGGWTSAGRGRGAFGSAAGAAARPDLVGAARLLAGRVFIFVGGATVPHAERDRQGRNASWLRSARAVARAVVQIHSRAEDGALGVDRRVVVLVHDVGGAAAD